MYSVAETKSSMLDADHRHWGVGLFPMQADEAGQPVLLRQVACHRPLQLLQGLLCRSRGAQAWTQQPGAAQREQQGV